ncbi:MAG TPA: ABC transporter ATP-binding protein [Bacilli bacterium]|nr:ABC transporter ATP-binding protein [Bacilli bacterium]
MTPILQMNQVTKRIKNKTLVDGLTLSVQPGEVFGLLGPNGAGKTTAIRMMVGLMKMSEGDVLIEGASIATNFREAIVKVGAIVENPEMYKYLSGYRNLVHFARMMPDVSEERIREVVKLVGLEHRIHDKVRTYSLGMRQRLGVAQALLHRPRLLILDEPTNGLDPAGIRELRDYLRKLAREEGIAVVVSSHLLAEVQLMCDRVAIIQHGKLIDVQSVHAFLESRHLTQVEIEVDNIMSAVRLLEPADVVTDPESRTLKLQLEHEQIPATIDRLVRGAVRVYGVTKQTRTLEDKFLEITGGESVV